LGSYFLRLDEEAVDEDYERFDLITVPMGLWISPKAAKKLRAFVKNGGVLVADAGFGEYTQQGLLWSDCVPGFGLAEVFGVRRTEVVTHPKVGEFPIDTARPVTHSIDGRDMQTCWQEEWLAPDGAEVIGSWPGGQPAVTVNRYGKGKAVYIGSSATLAYSHNEDPALLELYRRLTAEIPRPAWTERTDTHVRTLHRGKQRLYFVFNYCPNRVGDTLRLAQAPQRLKNLLTGEKVAFDKGPDGAAVRLDMPAYQTLVLLGE
jgi:beta-galactosidase GanA